MRETLVTDLMREIKAGTLTPMCASRSRLLVAIFVATTSVAHAQNAPGYGGCTEGVSQLPALTPALQSATDLRCFSVVSAHTTAHAPGSSHTPLFPLVLTTAGVASVGLAIGIGIGGASLGVATGHDAHVDAAFANVALSIGITAIVTGIVLLVLPRR